MTPEIETILSILKMGFASALPMLTLHFHSFKVAWIGDNSDIGRRGLSVNMDKIRKFQKLGSVHMFPASLPSKLQNLVITGLKHLCPFPYRDRAGLQNGTFQV